MAEDNEKAKHVYDDIATDYDIIAKTNGTNIILHPVFWSLLGDVTGKSILDLACGTGNIAREMKLKGARNVVGVDISATMIALARESESLGVRFEVGDAATYEDGSTFDTVVSLYLLCYAESETKLEQFCQTAYKHTKPGGRFISLTAVLDKDAKMEEDMEVGYQHVDVDQGLPSRDWRDGQCIQVTLFSDDKKSTCSFPNYRWTILTMKRALIKAGFSSFEVHMPHKYLPTNFIVAYRK